ncbi:MAG: ribonucleoside-triphosphate reductase [Candidatus Aenigmarchaeota archaeon]|nr:ribonucleoside-triphosphate reductase [Candidatus Aenigmarchaeota archaeon]
MSITQIRKRDGRIAPFDKEKIATAIFKAAQAVGGHDKIIAEKLADQVVSLLQEMTPPGAVPQIEDVQDLVEKVLIEEGHAKTAKAYILYRQERAKIREKEKVIPEHVKQLAQESKKYFHNALAEFIYYRTYSRWIEQENRRETWIETVDRYVNFMRENLGTKLTEEEYREIKNAILKQEAMPSMRLLWSAGKAAHASNVSAYNCSYVAPTQLDDFGDIMYLLMCGAGVGFSVESQTVQQLPIIKRQTGIALPVHVIEDSKEGWADALRLGLHTWYTGKDVAFDYVKIRPAGSRLRTMGGQSSGPEPLRALLDFSRRKILGAQGKRLRNIDVHDIICKIGEVVVMGGVRRSALISLSDLDDEEMRRAKMGQFYITEPQRSMANNSAVYNEKPNAAEFLEEWVSLAKSGTGERGIYNRGGLKRQLPARRWEMMGEHAQTCGSNPCGEIILRSKQFCNLTEVVARADDTEETLLKKTRIAAILGTFQATLTNFPYISREWKQNCEEERLLGVSITGQWDCAAVRNADVLRKMRERAIDVNKTYAQRFGIRQAAAITCVKPSGTVSQLVDAASGMHPRHAPYYIRRVRISGTDPLFQMLKEQKFPYHPEVGQAEGTATTYVLEFPVKAPVSVVYKNDLTAMQQLLFWKLVKENYTEHNPSVTISIGEYEWIETANWIYQNWDMIGGLAFLPREENSYQLAPFEEITKEQYEELVRRMPAVDFSWIVAYEKGDQTIGSKELACVSGVCEADGGCAQTEQKSAVAVPA